MGPYRSFYRRRYNRHNNSPNCPYFYGLLLTKNNDRSFALLMRLAASKGIGAGRFTSRIRKLSHRMMMFRLVASLMMHSVRRVTSVCTLAGFAFVRSLTHADY